MRRESGRSMFLPLAGLLSALLIFSSCVTMEVESDFNEDGSATHSMELTLDMSDLEQFGEGGEFGDPFENFDQIEEEAAEQGFRVERIEDGDVVGVRLIQDVEDSSDLGAILNNLINAGSEGDEEVEPFSGSFDKDGDDYRLDLTVDGSELTNTAGEGLGEGGESGDLDELGIDMSMIFDFTYAARMPGEIAEDDTNGSIGDDGLVTWEMPLEGSATFTAASSTDGGGSEFLLILIVIGVIVLGLIALAVVAFLIFMNRRGSRPATAAPVGPAPVAPAPPPQSYSATSTEQAFPAPPPAVDPNQPTQRIASADPEPDEPGPERRNDPPPSY